MTEKLCLQWNDFRDNVNCAFRSLREDADFADVILVCEDGKQVEAHKVILAASSPFFQSLLRRNNHPHPLIYMRGMKSEDLVDFLYRGEANVFQENLDSFLAIAEELQLKGLTGQGSGDGNSENDKVFGKGNTVPGSEQTLKGESKTSKSTGFEQPKQNDQINECDKANQSVALTSQFSGELQEIDEKVKAMLEKTHNITANGRRSFYVCKVCGKEGEDPTNMKRHVEANHLEGVLIPCHLCEKTARSRHALTMHMRNHHKD